MNRPLAEIRPQGPSAVPGRPGRTPQRRSTLRSVLAPTEHGGWGLTLEPVLLGLVVAPSWSGVGLGISATILFLARTPFKILLVDLHRNRRLPRTRMAAGAVGCYALALSGCLAVPLVQAPVATWLPLIVIAPMVGTELWYDMRSRGRRLVPELAGAIGIAGVAAMIVIADARPASVAGACWVLLAARAVTSIINVRDLVQGLHGRRRNPASVWAGDIAALSLAAVAVAIEPAATVGAVAIAALIVVQRLLRLRRTPRAVILGITQTGLGLVVVAATAIGMLQA
ncbi:YwiC-like family protein [Aquihabitans daechungensis]|uniref:YwiC-like family protein n=1 Tax=Aquihabitans daechungensis TaxID=1052257 RepID=UPI003B9EA8DD